PVDLLLVNQGGGFLDHVRLVDHIGDLGGDDHLLVASFFDLHVGFATNDYSSSSCLERRFYSIVSVDNAACRKIRRDDVLHQLGHRDVTVVYIGHNAIDDLSQIVWGHIGSHTHSNPGSSVQQQCWNFCRKYRRLLE